MIVFLLAGCKTEPVSEIAKEELPQYAAQAICDSLFQCCDAQSQEDYFVDYQNDLNLEGFHSFLPPNKTLDPQTCPSIMEDILVQNWLGDWLEKVSLGMVHYDHVEAASCFRALQEDEC